jgi:hypothetical protein
MLKQTKLSTAIANGLAWMEENGSSEETTDRIYKVLWTLQHPIVAYKLKKAQKKNH